MRWTWPRGASAQYCVKVSTATLIGYLASFGGPTYAIYGAFTAALVVGTSRGEDTNSAANRVRGSLAGMLASVAFTMVPMPPLLAVTLAVGATAYLCMGFGWGVSAVRIGGSLCAVTILMHSRDAVGYNLMRVGNTLIGIAAGLLVSYLVLPVRGRDALARAMKRALAAVSDLMATLAHAEREPTSSQYMALLESLSDLQKVLSDARNEVGGEAEALRQTARQVALACIGTLSAAIAHAQLRASPDGLSAASGLRRRAAVLAERAASHGRPAVERGNGAPTAPVPRGEAVPAATLDEMALQGFALALREIDSALDALGR